MPVGSKSHGSDLGMVHEGFLSWQLQKEVVKFKLKFDLTNLWFLVLRLCPAFHDSIYEDYAVISA